MNAAAATWLLVRFLCGMATCSVDTIGEPYASLKACFVQAEIFNAASGFWVMGWGCARVRSGDGSSGSVAREVGF